MTGGPQYWNYTTTFFPRFGNAEVTYGTPGCTIIGLTFPVHVVPAGYVYNSLDGTKIQGADVWLQWPDEAGNWVNVPAGLEDPPMQPDLNPFVTNRGGQYQWDVVPGSYRVYVESPGYYPAAGPMVNTPPPFSGMNVALTPLPRPPVITSISPVSRQAGSGPFNLTVSGGTFTTASRVRWNGSDRPTVFISSYYLNASIPAADIATPGTAAVTVYNSDTGLQSENRTFTITAGPVPPASITNLTNTTYQPDLITWTWTDPSTAGFDHVLVYLDGVFQANVTNGIQTFTATGLSPGTAYTIGTRTVGTTGIINGTWVNQTARTAVPSGPGILWVASYPRDATISLDGIIRGQTNQFVFNIPSGTRNLTLMKGGYQTTTLMVTVPAGLKVLPPITLQRGEGPTGTGTLYVASYPSDATILIDGTVSGLTDQLVYGVPSGDRNLTLEKDGYRPRTITVQVPAGDIKVLPPVNLEHL